MAGELLASLSDINAFLDDKAEIGDGDDDKFQVEAQRIIKAMLAGVFKPTTLAAWNAPGSTPDLIRGIAGRLIAAYWYKRLYSEDVTDIPQYAQDLYNQAVGMLSDIRNGNLLVLDNTDTVIEESGLQPNATWFYPNDTAPPPKFSMDMEFG